MELVVEWQAAETLDRSMFSSAASEGSSRKETVCCMIEVPGFYPGNFIELKRKIVNSFFRRRSKSIQRFKIFIV
jgi:hypothetical protein